MKYLDRLRESFHTSFECLNPTLSTLRVLGFTQLILLILNAREIFPSKTKLLDDEVVTISAQPLLKHQF